MYEILTVAPLRDQELSVIERFINLTFVHVAVHSVKSLKSGLLIDKGNNDNTNMWNSS